MIRVGTILQTESKSWRKGAGGGEIKIVGRKRWREKAKTNQGRGIQHVWNISKRAEPYTSQASKYSDMMGLHPNGGTTTNWTNPKIQRMTCPFPEIENIQRIKTWFVENSNNTTESLPTSGMQISRDHLHSLNWGVGSVTMKGISTAKV